MRARNLSIDAFRVVANLVIILVHTRPFMGQGFSTDTYFVGALLNQFVRIATPFFFMAGGYFFAASVARGAEPLPLAARLSRRLALFFVFWSFIYIAVPLEFWLQSPDMTYAASVHAALARCLSPKFLLNGSRVHLWFLPAMICGIALLAAAVRLHLQRALFMAAALLFVVGLLGGSYKSTPIGFDPGFGTRNGPFLSALFIVTGYFAHEAKLAVSVRAALALILAGTLLRSVEVWWICGHSPTLPSQMEYLLGTYPFGLGIFFLVLRSKRLGQVGWMVWLSRYSGGIYCAHMLFVDYFALRPVTFGDPFWELARPLVILALSVALVVAMARVPALKPAVT